MGLTAMRLQHLLEKNLPKKINFFMKSYQGNLMQIEQTIFFGIRMHVVFVTVNMIFTDSYKYFLQKKMQLMGVYLYVLMKKIYTLQNHFSSLDITITCKYHITGLGVDMILY